MWTVCFAKSLPKLWFCCWNLSLYALVLNQISKERFWWSRKEELYCFARQRKTQQAPALKNCMSPKAGEFSEEFYGNGSRVGLLIRSRLYRACPPLVAQTVKPLPTMWETWVRSLGREDSLEKEMATHSSTSCLEDPMDRGAWCRLLSMGSQRVGHNWATSLHFTPLIVA